MKPALSILQDKLQESALFAQVPGEQLKWLAERASYLCLKKGEYLFRYGGPIDQMAILLQGHIIVKQHQGPHPTAIKEIRPGEVSGALPYSRASTAIADSQAQEESELLMLPKKFFREMIQQHYELVEVLVHSMTSRVRKFTESRQQSEKMAALGKLSAGLAHELNNPASAVVRSASALKEQLQILPAILQKMLAAQPDENALNELHKLLKPNESNTAAASASLLEKNSLEEELAAWLKEQNIPNPYELADTLSDLQLQTQDLQNLSHHFKAGQLPAVLSWISQLLSIEKLTGEIYNAASRMAELVQAVKSYSHMDKSPEKEEVNLLEGIQNTLTLLNFKIKKKAIQVNFRSADDLPKACVYAGELNQVWTNLLDNAIDAVPEKGGIIQISLSCQDHYIVMSFRDNGKGIPEQEKNKVFDPYYSTKSSGEGSGLGLDIVKRIVEKHQGKIELHSKPGNTEFLIFIPLLG